MNGVSGADAGGAAARSPLLSVGDLRTWFSTPRGVVRAVDGVSFELETGETLGVVGESGSGKSVLVRQIMRLNPAYAMTSGSVSFQGRDLGSLSSEEARRIWGNDIAMVFQNPMTSLSPVMRIGRQVTDSLKCHFKMGDAEAKSRAVELLRLVGIPEPERRLKAYPHELSGGMRQRVCIAIAIACEPKLLLADEPTTALDVTIQRQILDLMRDLRDKSNMTMVLVTHDLGVVAGLTDRMLVMYGGRVVETGPTVTLFQQPRHPYTGSLLAAIPRIEQPSHTRLVVIPGRPVDVLDPTPSCRFAARCERAQERCVIEDPPLVCSADDPAHSFACFFPLGSPEGDDAVRRNREARRTVAGLAIAEPTGAGS